MKFTITALLFTTATLFTGFAKAQHSIPGCYTSFKGEGLKAQAPAALTEDEKTMNVATAAGNINMAFTNGYTVTYTTKKSAEVVTLKVVQANTPVYAKDTAAALANLLYLNKDDNMESKGLITLSYNGYKIYGISHNTTADKGAQGSFVMFPGKNIIVYITFNNIAGSTEKPEDYKGRRNAFLGAYTAHIQHCR